MVVKGADSLNRFKGFSGQQDDSLYAHAIERIWLFNEIVPGKNVLCFLILEGLIEMKNKVCADWSDVFLRYRFGVR